jgi:hypothetical protein
MLGVSQPEIAQLLSKLTLNDVEPGVRLDTNHHEGACGTAYALCSWKSSDYMELMQYSGGAMPNCVVHWLEKLDSTSTNILGWIKGKTYWEGNHTHERRLLFFSTGIAGGYDEETYGFPKASVPLNTQIFAERTVSEVSAQKVRAIR